MAEETRHREETKLICGLARGLSHVRAAQEAGVSIRTVQRRASDPAFRAAVGEARRAMVGEATGRLAGAAQRAVATLEDLLESDADSVRLGASRAILDNLLRFREAEELSDRVRHRADDRDEIIDSDRAGANGQAATSGDPNLAIERLGRGPAGTPR